MSEFGEWLSNAVAEAPEFASFVASAAAILCAIAVAGALAKIKLGRTGVLAVFLVALLLSTLAYVLVREPVPSYFPPETAALRVVNFAISAAIAFTLVLLPILLFGGASKPLKLFMLGLPGLVVAGFLSPVLPAVVACRIMMMECL